MKLRVISMYPSPVSASARDASTAHAKCRTSPFTQCRPSM